ncbi:hypothetical protein AGMMS4952_03100 [Spirochaetia bacterium]|nr:hypothetical protein AGMMS4952_03100 [Spirochaetia bacterium]
MVRNGIVIATLSENAAGIMESLLILEGRHDFPLKKDFCWSENEKDLWRVIKQSAPRLVFIEHCFDITDTKGLIKRLCDRYRHLHVVGFAMGACAPRTAARLVNFGAESFLDLHGGKGDAKLGAGVILRGGLYMPAEIEDLSADMEEQPNDENCLTRQQKRIYVLLLECKTQSQMAEIMQLSVNTIKTHRQNIKVICGGGKLLDFQQYGLKHGLVKVDDLIRIEGYE